MTAEETDGDSSVEMCRESRVGRLYKSVVSGKRHCSNANCAGSLGFPRSVRGSRWNREIQKGLR